MADSSDLHTRFAAERRSDFVGREWLVERVRAWRKDPQGPRFVLITGGAGIGKSAFAAHLWQDLNVVEAAHFCVGGWGSTVEPAQFVRNLAEQLAGRLPGFAETLRGVLQEDSRRDYTIYNTVQTGDVAAGGQVTGVKVNIEVRTTARSAFVRLLREPLKRMAEAGDLQVTLLVDALDEALTYGADDNILTLLAGAGDFPSGVRFVLTSRGEPAVLDCFEKAQAPLLTIDAHGVKNQGDIRAFLGNRWDEDESLRQTGSSWGWQREQFISEMGRRGDWNFLYLGNVLPLLSAGLVEDPDHLPAGLADYYRYLLTSRVGKRRWEDWGADLAEVLLELQEPGSLEQIAAILGWQPRPTRQRLMQFSQLLDPVLLEHERYYRNHWSVVEFFADGGTAGNWPFDLKAGHAKIARYYLGAWGGLEAGLPLLDRETAARHDYYGLRQTCLHLEGSGAAPDVLLQLIRKPWADAWEGYEGSSANYLRDVQLVRRNCEREDEIAVKAGRPAPWLAGEIFCALIESSIHSLAHQLPPELPALLVKNHIWQGRQALAHVRQMPEDESLAVALSTLAPLLSPDLQGTAMAEALDAARHIEDEHSRTQVLSALAPGIPSNLMAKAIEVAGRIENELFRAQALIALVPHLPKDLLSKTVEIARNIEDKNSQTQVLIGLALYLPLEQKAQTLAEAFAAASHIDDAYLHIQVSCTLAPYLPSELKTQILAEALEASRHIEEDGFVSQALITLAPLLPSDMLGIALEVTRQIEEEGLRAHTLSALASHLPSDLLIEVLKDARDIKDSGFRGEVLSILAPHLPPDLQSKILLEAFNTVSYIENDSNFAQALSALTPLLTPDMLVTSVTTAFRIQNESCRSQALKALFPRLSSDLLERTIEIARCIDDEYYRVQAISALAPYLSPEPQAEILSEALKASHHIEDAYSRCKAFLGLVPFLSPEQKARTLDEALDVTRHIEDANSRCKVLRDLVPFLPSNLLTETLEIVRHIEDDDSRSKALNALSAYLSPDLLIEVFEDTRQIEDCCACSIALSTLSPYLQPDQQAKAIEIARRLKKDDLRAEALRVLASSLPADLKHTLLVEAFDAACKIKDDISRAQAIISMAPSLPYETLVKAVEVVCHVKFDRLRNDALKGLAPRLPPDLQRDALEAIRKIKKDEYARAQGLSIIAPYLSLDLQAEALEEGYKSICQIKSEYIFCMVVSDMAAFFPTNQKLIILTEALKAIRRIKNIRSRAQALCALAPHLPSDLLAEALEITYQIKEDDAYAKVLNSLAPRLSPDLLAEAFNISRSIKNINYRTQALSALSQCPAPNLQFEILTLTLKLVRRIDDDDLRTEILSALAPHLPPDLLKEAFEATCKIEDDFSFAFVLSSLAPHLPPDLLAEALDTARQIQDEDKRAAARQIEDESKRNIFLINLLPQLQDESSNEIFLELLDTYHEKTLRISEDDLDWDRFIPFLLRQPVELIYAFWQIYFRSLVTGTRSKFLEGIRRLALLIQKLGGESVYSEIARGIITVGEWWP